MEEISVSKTVLIKGKQLKRSQFLNVLVNAFIFPKSLTASNFENEKSYRKNSLPNLCQN